MASKGPQNVGGEASIADFHFKADLHSETEVCTNATLSMKIKCTIATTSWDTNVRYLRMRVDLAAHYQMAGCKNPETA